MTSTPSSRARRAFTLVEAAVCTVIVGVMLTAALNAAGVARSRQQNIIDRENGMMLAQQLMAEIMDKPYADPAGSILGLELDEIGQPRSAFDDVDDYDRWAESPPAQANGTAITGFSRWSRSVSVAWVTSSDLSKQSLVETDLKKITVTVSKNGVPMAVLTGLRARARDSL